MENRNKLISLAIKYAGNYDLIRKAIIRNEDVEERFCPNAITIFDDAYPIELFDLNKSPFVLFYRGDISLLKRDKISIVGSRRPCDYALFATEKYVQKVRDEKVIVSGLAKGIDACAHKNAKMTIGVLGCGIDYIYPAENKDLYKRMEQEGLLISEYPYKTIPNAYHFPFRNRIITALGEEVLIMEAKNKSGTLTTVNEALALGRTIRVLPFEVFNENGNFNNQLIQEGAEILKYEDIN